MTDARNGIVAPTRLGAAWIELTGVAVLCAVVVLWSGQVAFSQAVWSPIDEGSHWLAANAIASGTYPQGGVPTGRMPAGLPPWSEGAIIEVVQPPVNYAMMAVVEKGVHLMRKTLPARWGIATNEMATVYAMRLSNTVLFGAIVVILWLAARSIAPGRLPLAWGMPATLLVFHGPLLDSTRAGNDVLVAVLASLAVYLALRWRHDPTVWHGAVVGLVAALATLSKYTGVFALVPVGLLALAHLRADPHRVLVSSGVGAVAWALPVVFWLAVASRLGLGVESMVGRNPPTFLFHRSLAEVAQDIPLNLWNLLFSQWAAGSPDWPRQMTAALIGLAALLVLGGLVIHRHPTASSLSTGEGLALLISVPAIVVVLAAFAWLSGLRFVRGGRYDLVGILPLAYGVLAWLPPLPPLRLRDLRARLSSSCVRS